MNEVEKLAVSSGQLFEIEVEIDIETMSNKNIRASVATEIRKTKLKSRKNN